MSGCGWQGTVGRGYTPDGRGGDRLARMNFVGLGLVFGAGIGMLLATVLGASIALGLGFGAGLGLVIGAMIRQRKQAK